MEENYNRRSFAPINIGDELNVKIESVGEKGDGVAKVKGFVIFIPNTKVGDEVKVRITKVLRKMSFAEVITSSSETNKKDTDTEDELREEELQADEY